MIHVDRIGAETPEELRPEAVAVFYDDLRRQTEKPIGTRERRTLPFVPVSPTLRNAVKALFSYKCAYCELLLAPDELGDVDHFRPKVNAVGNEGDVEPDHYWWLAYEWENLYLSCATCNRKHKRSRFPVSGTRAQPEARGEKLYAERPLLLDPCDPRPDRDPERHLVYEPDGNVYSGSDEGRATIEILGLNRQDLTERRERHYAYVHALVDEASEVQRGERAEPATRADQQYVGTSNGYEPEIERSLVPIRDAISAGAELAGMARQIARRGEIEGLGDLLKGTERVTKAEAKQVKFDHRKQRQKQETYTLDEEQAEGYYLGTRYIERIVIDNFRGIRHLDVDLTRRDANDPYVRALTMDRPYPPVKPEDAPLSNAEVALAPWTMLLGENATGKSSVLKAVALALVGEDYRADLADTNAGDYVRRPRCRRGEVVVHLTEPTAAQRLEFRKDQTRFEGAADAKVLVLGYGATRLLPRPSHPAPAGRRYGRVENLFDPFVPVIDADRFLLDTYREDPDRRFRFVLDALERLLGFGEEERIFPEDSEMLVRLAGATVPLAWLSDGYQSLLALACDIMAKLLQRWDSMDVAEGVVLLDEIGAHMHPRWRMRIVRRLREAFPRVQFIATTHDPLCLRWLVEGEVVVMRRDSNGDILAVQDGLPQIGGMPVDQLLTSEHFGLAATIDPQVEDLFDEYYVLLGMDKRTGEQNERLAQLKTVLFELDQLGATRRERLMLEAIDRYLAKEPNHLKDQSPYMAKLDRELDRILESEELR